MAQANFFEQPGGAENFPEGLRYRARLIAQAEEKTLITRLRELPFKEFEFHGYKGKRRTVSFGWQYEFSGRGRLQKANDIPHFILPLRAIAGEFAHIEPESLQHVLVIEYGPGAGIGWHRDKPVFGEVVCVSLLAPCFVRFRRKMSAEIGREVTTVTSSDGFISDRVGKLDIGSSKLRSPKRATWERMKLLAEPRSAYHLAGAARYEWQHSILGVAELRYSITFRTLSAV